MIIASCKSNKSKKSRIPHKETSTHSGDQIPILRALRFPENTIHIDGKLNEPVWEHTEKTRAFVHPNDGKPRPRSPVNANARIGWDAEWLYIAFVINERNPTSPFSAKDVDPHVWEHSSAAEIMIQPGNPFNNKHYYEIQVDVAGAVWDTRFNDYNIPITGGTSPASRRYGHQDWRSKLQKGIKINKQAGNYTIELAIPWSSLPSPQANVPPKSGETWRINLYSFRDGQREALAWSPTLRQGNFHKASRFGRVIFIER